APVLTATQTPTPATTPAPTGTTPTLKFTAAKGQIHSSSGAPFIARGVDVHSDNLAAAAADLPTQFPGINMVRVAVGDYEPLADPASFQAAVNSLTSKGIVVEFSDYSNSLGTGSGGSQGVVYTGTQLAAGSAWYSAMVSMHKNNPYVWFGTDNEPATTGGSLSDWQLATYNAIRSPGNSNPI